MACSYCGDAGDCSYCGAASEQTVTHRNAMSEGVGELVERLIEIADNYADYPIGNGARLTLRETADALTNLQARLAEVTGALRKVQDRCFEAEDRNWQHDILSIVVPITDAALSPLEEQN